MFKKFTEISATTWIALATLAAIAVILYVISRTNRKWSAKMIASGALAIALSFVLSCVRLYRMPTGGSVTLGSMLPLMLFAAAYGVGPGLLAGLAYGLLQYLQGGWWLNVWQFILDYLLAFAALGLAGVAHDKSDKWLYIGIPVAALGRAVCAILAGLMWASDSLAKGYALTVGSADLSGVPLWYSIVYNGVYLIPDTVICLILALLVGRQLVRIMKQK